MPPKVQSLRLKNKTFDFVHVPLHFVDDLREDVFANKNNKTLRETLAHRRYASLAAACATKYSQHLDSPLGEVLLRLKVSGDAFYQTVSEPLRRPRIFDLFHLRPVRARSSRRLRLLLQRRSGVHRPMQGLHEETGQPRLWEDSSQELLSRRAGDELPPQRPDRRRDFRCDAVALPDG